MPDLPPLPSAAVPADRLAIVLFNLGGPDRLESVRPFLLNLFTDPAILRVPFFIRPLLARLIAGRRVAPATENYRLMGGASPLLELTQAQAAALEQVVMADAPGLVARCFIAMRYWHPFSAQAVAAVQEWCPDRVVLIPLYPHYSTTTTGSSLVAWRDAAARAGLARPTQTLCCYPVDPGFVAALAARVAEHWHAARGQAGGPVRILFSAHGLPQVIVDRGDPYRFQIEATATAIAASAGLQDADWQVCFQSRATPQRWLEPSIDQALRQAAADQVAVLVVPVAFVSDHSETLVELDIEYAEVARRLGVPAYFRVPAQNSDAGFIAALAALVRSRGRAEVGTCGADGGRLCPHSFTDCPMLP